MSDDKIKPFSVISKNKKEEEVFEKTHYIVYFNDGRVEEIIADIMDPTYSPMVLFADYDSAESATIKIVLNFNEISSIEITH